MRLVTGLLSCLCLAQFSQALAAEPPTDQAAAASTQPSAAAKSPTAAPANNPSSAAPASASSANATATSPPAAANGVTAAKSDDDAEDKRLRALGYRPEIRSNGQTYYCRRESTLGSRFETKVCATAQNLRNLTQNSKEALEEVQRHKITRDGH